MKGQPPDDGHVKHLEFIQAVIARLANDSFLMKGWTLTVGGAFFGFAAKDLNWRVAAIGLLPVAGFWGLDAYYLRQERLFRCLYDAVRQPDTGVEPFAMDIRRYQDMVDPWWGTMRSETLLPFYGIIFFAGFVLILAGVFSQ